MTAAVHTRTRLRRYPALGFLVAAALMASLLPSALRVPLSGPSASAELAPVPGESDQAGDLNALGQTSTGGLGSGSGIGGNGDGTLGGDGALDGGPSGSGRNIRHKRCVGNPLRQTEDPMSPACVAFFGGDNFGATWQGVTENEIVIVHVRNCNTDGTFELTDYSDPSQESSGEAALMRYFNSRFQTYKRTVRLFGVGATSAGTSCSATHMKAIDERLQPFYVFRSAGGITQEMAAEAARLGFMAQASRPLRELTQRHAPFMVSYRADIEDFAANMAEAVCARLAGGRARHAGDPTMHGTRRKFGLYYDSFSSDPQGVGADLILDGIRRRCHDAAGDVVVGHVATPSTRGTSDAIRRMRLENVTTVIGTGAMSDSTVFAEAEASKWYPEWFLGDDQVGLNATSRTHPPTVMRGVFGLMDERRQGAPGEQYHRQAAAEGCPGCTITGSVSGLYRVLMLAFTGIQAAGPRLTPHNFDRGMRALPARQSRDPFAPSAYFAPGNHSFLKDYAVAWWDATGQPPGTSTPGCWRLVEDGLRYRAEDWAKRPGDHGIREPGQPCQGDQ